MPAGEVVHVLFLKKVVPVGEKHIAFIKNVLELKSNDCEAFAQQFKDHGNFTAAYPDGTVDRMGAQADVEVMCKNHPSTGLVLTRVFPDFSKGDLLFEEEHLVADRKVHALWRTHSCSKIGKIVRSNILFGESASVPEHVRQAGEQFVTQILEKGSCAAYSRLAETDVTVRLHGDPHQVTKGGQTVIDGVSNARSACELKAARERRMTTSTSLAIERVYYDAGKNELTLVAKKQITTVFRPGMVVDKPTAVALKFSKTGKIQVADFYETEVLHLEKKWGHKYGKQDSISSVEQKHDYKKVLNSWWQHALSKVKAKAPPKEEGLKSLPPLVQQQKCAWLEERERLGEVKWLKEKPWYDELVSLCTQREHSELQHLPAAVTAKKCAWLQEKKHSEPLEMEVTRVRALAMICIKQQTAMLAQQPAVQLSKG